MHKYGMGDGCLGSSIAEKHLGVLVDHRLNMTQQHDAVICIYKNKILICINRSVICKMWEFVSLALVRSQLEY